MVGSIAAAWDAYWMHAAGADELCPLTRSGKDWLHVSLTAAGRRMESAAAGVQEEVRCRTLLDPHEVEVLRGQLKKLARILDAE